MCGISTEASLRQYSVVGLAMALPALWDAVGASWDAIVAPLPGNQDSFDRACTYIMFEICSRKAKIFY